MTRDQLDAIEAEVRDLRAVIHKQAVEIARGHRCLDAPRQHRRGGGRMNPMVERVAQAIIRIGADDIDTMPPDRRAPFRRWLKANAADFACAAIEAMREPTFDPDRVSYHQGMTRTDWWRAMIDEALAEDAPQ